MDADLWFQINQALCCAAPLAGILITIFLWTKYGKEEIEDHGVVIIPPSNISPAILPGLMRNDPINEESLAATIIDLISKGYLDIKESEKKNKKNSEETEIILKKRDKKLEEHEKIVLDMVFTGKAKKVNLDKFLEDAEENKEKKEHLIDKYKKFEENIIKKIDGKKFFDKKGSKLSVKIATIFFVIGILSFLFLPMFAFGLIVGAVVIGIGSIFIKKVNKNWINEYSKWKSFEKSIENTLIKENPPSSVIIWERILAYAAALGKADKVMKNMSELKVIPKLLIEKIRKLNTSVNRFGRGLTRTYVKSGRASMRGLGRKSRFSSRSRSSSSSLRSSGFRSSSFRSGGFRSGGFRGGGRFR